MIEHHLKHPRLAKWATRAQRWAVPAIAVAAGAGCATGPAPQHLYQERALNDELVARVAVGSSRAEVRAHLGGPARIGIDRPTGDEEWLWRYSRYGYQSMCFYTRFDRDGRVAGTALALESSSADFLKLC